MKRELEVFEKGEAMTKSGMRQMLRSLAVGVLIGIGAAMLLAATIFGMCGCGGEDGKDCEPLDFYQEHYAECVDACVEARMYAAECGLEQVSKEECIDAAWHRGLEPYKCVMRSACHRELLIEHNCEFEAFDEHGAPHLYIPCPVEY